jgi:sulfhydrogenase subunit gamma (sulfur reductase)
MLNPFLPVPAKIIERVQESPSLFTLRMRFTDPELHAKYSFTPGQFNMLYLHGVGEVPISIVSDPLDEHILDHTIRSVGRVTRGIAKLSNGDVIGVRGPYGRGWPLIDAEQRDIIIVTGGLGCAPVVSVINYILRRRERFGFINIVQGVKHSSDFIWKERYDKWRQYPDTRVLLAADAGEPLWPWHVGPVTGLFNELRYDKDRVLVMLCGPEGLMRVVIKYMLEQEISETALWLSMERSMYCGTGLCGHCQYGAQFTCRDGPVFCYADIKHIFGSRGF